MGQAFGPAKWRRLAEWTAPRHSTGNALFSTSRDDGCFRRIRCTSGASDHRSFLWSRRQAGSS